MGIPDDVELDPKKVALGCEKPKGKEDRYLCQPRIEHNNKLIPMTKDGPIEIREMSDGNWEIRRGAKDMTVEKEEVFKEALKKSDTLKR